MFGEPSEIKNKETLREYVEVRGRVGWKGYKKEDLRDTGPLVLGATHIDSNGNINLTEPVFISEDKYEESPEIMLEVNDLIFVQRGNTIGKIGLFNNEKDRATINPCVLILRPIKINPIYLKNYFLMDSVKKDMWKLNSGSAQPMITQKGISNYKIFIPEITTQNQFAVIVKQIDKQKFVGTKIARLLGKIAILC